MADDKKYLRKILRECRSALPRPYVTSASGAVQLQVLESVYYREAATVALYAAKDNEIGTDALLADSLKSGRRVVMPKVFPQAGELLMVRVSDRAELAPGSFGVLEPMGAEVVPVVELASALICVPGVAFSRIGQRLGRGGGYFDRMLATIGSRAVAAGLAYSFQLLDRLPESPNDWRLNLIFTESALHVAAGQGESLSP